MYRSQNKFNKKKLQQNNAVNILLFYVGLVSSENVIECNENE